MSAEALLDSAFLLPLALVLGVLGAPLAAIGLVFRTRIAGFNRRAREATAPVVGNHESRSTSRSIWRTIYYPEVQFTTPEGQVVRARGLGQAQPAAIGGGITLLYDPRSPQEVSFTGPRGQSGIAGMLALMGGACLAGAFGLAALAVLV